MPDEDKPHLRVVASTDKPAEPPRESEEARRKRAEQDLAYPLLQMAANVLRVVRGAGKPYELYRDCHRIISAFNAYVDEFGHMPPDWVISNHMQVEISERDGRSFRADEWAFEKMVRGSLQLAAATLLHQKMQISTGEEELLVGVRLYEEYVEAQRAEWAAAATKTRAGKRAPGKRKKPPDIVL